MDHHVAVAVWDLLLFPLLCSLSKLGLGWAAAPHKHPAPSSSGSGDSQGQMDAALGLCWGEDISVYKGKG